MEGTVKLIPTCGPKGEVGAPVGRRWGWRWALWGSLGARNPPLGDPLRGSLAEATEAKRERKDIPYIAHQNSCYCSSLARSFGLSVSA